MDFSLNKMKKLIVVSSLLFIACGGIMPPPVISQVDRLVVKRNNGVNQFSAVDQTNEAVTIQAFNGSVEAETETIVFQVEAPVNAIGQGVTSPTSGVTNANGKVKFDLTTGDSLGTYTVHCVFRSDTLLSVPFEIIDDTPYQKELAKACERKLNALFARFSDLKLSASTQETFTDEDGVKRNKGKKTQNPAENNNVKNEVDNLWKTLGRLAALGDDRKL